MNYYFIEYKYSKSFNAGSKARNDVAEILISMNFKPIYIERPKKLIDKILHLININKFLNNIEEESIVVIQWPLASKKYIKRINNILSKKKCKTIIMIHDITNLRGENLYKNNEEIDILNKFDCIISHNKKMSDYLVKNGINRKIFEICIFDYLNDTKKNIENKKNITNYNTIAFAGNLIREKSGFIYKLSDEDLKNFKLSLYGDGINNIDISKKIEYKGKFNSNELPSKFKENFGLIWDGPSIKRCEDILGEYLKYNNPHKISLYIVSELPIIIWKEAALAEFVKNNNIGVLINSITDINKIKINNDDYNIMVNNIRKIKSKVENGEYTKTVIQKALDYLV